MRRFGKIVLVFILSVIIATLVASLFSTQFVIAALENSGAQVGWGDRLDMTLYDLGHLGLVYGIFISFGLLISFLAAALVHHFAKTKRPLIYVVAGMTCFVVMLYLMQAVFFGVPIIAGARSTLGLAFQASAGGIAGYVFAKLTRRETE
ncbi:MAG: hypothetical protein COC03_06295 [Robiginitomaculum sp.]|nr:MAG: hypothetical protein COC03_06295 [Robiginitomaculum sp.]PHQ66220.1 MAG: hypothetical protein COB92_08535 [Robiginitomaculum sp.]